MTLGWDQILTILEKTLNPGLFKVWIKPLSGSFDGETLEITAPNEFVASWVRGRLQDSIRDAAQQALGVSPKIKVGAQAAAVRVSSAAFARTAPAPRPQVQQASLFTQPAARPAVAVPSHNWNFNFDDFVVGPSNQLAHAASLSVCERSLGTEQLFLSSGTGLGKTHLLQAIGRYMGEKANRTPKVRYLTAEEFASRMVVSLKMGQIDQFKAQFREDVDLLLLEDIHFLQGKEKIQDELLATLKALQARGSKVVFTSSFLPKELSNVDNQLVSRFCSGFMAVIDRPDFETRRRIILDKASRKFQVAIPEQVTDLLAENIDHDIRQLESCLQNLILKARLMNEAITLDMAEQILSNYAVDLKAPGMDKIIASVCRTFQLSADELRSKSRKQNIVMARNTAFFLARKYTDLSLKAIGDQFNRRHSTVLKGITKLERELSMKTPAGRQIERALELVAV